MRSSTDKNDAQSSYAFHLKWNGGGMKFNTQNTEKSMSRKVARIIAELLHTCTRWKSMMEFQSPERRMFFLFFLYYDEL